MRLNNHWRWQHETMVTWCIWSAAALALVAIHALWVVPQLREPDDGVALGKRPYAELGTPVALTVLAATALASQLVTAIAPSELRPVWLVVGSSLLTLVWVDALTTWLPTTLLRLVAAEMTAALLVGAVLSSEPSTLLTRSLLGALASGITFWCVWKVSRGFGFGDVRLAPMIGAVAGTLGVSGWYTALLAGSIVGVIWGLLARRNPAPGTTNGFAYGPALWVGPYAAFAWQALTTT